MSTFKNKLLKLFMAGLLVLTSFAFLSCGGKGAGGEDNNSKSDIPSAEEVTANLKTLGDYDIVVEIDAVDSSEAMSLEMAKKGNIYWFVIAGGIGIAYKLEGNVCYYYLGSPDANKNITWAYVAEDSADSIDEQMETSFGASLFYASELPADLVKGGSAVVAGRNCTKYTWRDSAHGVTVSETVYIDNETGLCLKMEASGSYNGESESGSFEVKSFKTGNNVVAPDLPAPQAQD